MQKITFIQLNVIMEFQDVDEDEKLGTAPHHVSVGFQNDEARKRLTDDAYKQLLEEHGKDAPTLDDVKQLRLLEAGVQADIKTAQDLYTHVTTELDAQQKKLGDAKAAVASMIALLPDEAKLDLVR